MTRTPDETILSHLNPDDSELIYRPSAKEREQKARYWSRREEDLFTNSTVLNTREVCERYSGGRLRHWDKQGFQDWFLNKDEFRHKLDYLFGLCLDAAEDILLNQDPKVQSARVNLIRAVAELAGKVPHKQANIQIQAVSHQSARIGAMDQKDLERYLESQGELIEVLPLAEKPKD